jgi:crotonobetaine/carnitine-CoA ligase
MTTPDAVLLIDADSKHEVTFAEFDDQVSVWARRLAAQGVTSGDHVATILGSTFDAYYLWLGLSGLSAVEVPLNPQLRGRLLIYLINFTQCRILVTESAFLDSVLSVAADVETLERVIVIDQDVAHLPSASTLDVVGADGFTGEVAVDLRLPERHDTSCIIYTSGTTGPPKGVVIPWGWLPSMYDRTPESIKGGSRYSFLSPAHMSGKTALNNVVSEDRALVLRDGFSVSAFWDDIARYDCRVTQLFPAMIKYLLDQPASRNDGETPLAYFWTAPVNDNTLEFMRRFDVAVSTGFGSTETGGPFWGGDIDGSNPGSCGRVNTADPRGYEIRLVTENDYEVAQGEVGELIVRTAVPWTMNAGYFRNTEATADAWRNGWFHTGDAMREDADGNFYFVDRFKDCIRRKGENISSFEVEAYAMEAPGVADAAAIGVEAADGEQEVKIFVVAKGGESLSLAAVGEYLAGSMPRFMTPRYLELVDELPRTPTTGRVQKAKLRTQTSSGRSWDRQSQVTT